MSLLKTKISDFRYDEGNLSILKNIDLEIAQGELVVITGLSGCGKTTLTRILNGLIPHHYGGIFNGEVKHSQHIRRACGLVFLCDVSSSGLFSQRYTARSRLAV